MERTSYRFMFWPISEEFHPLTNKLHIRRFKGNRETAMNNAYYYAERFKLYFDDMYADFED